MSISQQMQNAQNDLYTKRPSHGNGSGHMQPVSEIDLLKAMKATAPTAELDAPDTTVRSHVAQLIARGPVKLASLDTSHPQVKQAVKMARLWAQRKRDGYQDASLILCGKNGAGKTHIALAIWWSMLDTVTDVAQTPGQYGEPLADYPVRPTGRFYLSNDLLGLMGQSRDPETGVVLPTRAASVIGYPPLIVIDDIGLEQAIPFVKHEQQEEERHARIFKVINHCVGNVSVIITSNKTWPELSNYIGKRAASRLLQMAPAVAGTGDSFIVDMFDVPDYRRKQGGR